MKIRTQRNGWECGVIAIYNAHVLAGITPPSLAHIRRSLKSDARGTSEYHMKHYINRIGWKRGVGKITILGYMVGNVGHYTVVKDGWAYNYMSDEALVKISHKWMKKRVKVSNKWLDSKIFDKNTEKYYVKTTL